MRSRFTLFSLLVLGFFVPASAGAFSYVPSSSSATLSFDPDTLTVGGEANVVLNGSQIPAPPTYVFQLDPAAYHPGSPTFSDFSISQAGLMQFANASYFSVFSTPGSYVAQSNPNGLFAGNSVVSFSHSITFNATTSGVFTTMVLGDPTLTGNIFISRPDSSDLVIFQETGTLYWNNVAIGSGSINHLFAVGVGAQSLPYNIIATTPTGFSPGDKFRFDVTGSAIVRSSSGGRASFGFIPEPSTALLTGFGMLGLLVVARRVRL